MGNYSSIEISPLPRLTRRSFIASAFATGTAFALGVDKPATRHPNIIFILADDMGYGDPSIYGQTKIRTPRIDRLAAEGARFTQGYAGAPVCAPSRCSLMTGMHAGHARVRDNFALAAGHVGHKKKEEIRRASLTPQDHTIADYLHTAGYHTGLMGKWHLDGYDPEAIPTKHGFDEFKGWLTQIEETQGYWPEKRCHNEQLIDIPENAGGKHGRYDTTMITEDSIEFIERHHTEPFFLYVAYDSPHSPYTAPDFGPYANHPNWADDEKTYAAMIWYMDKGIGQILDTLHRLNLDQDTVVFFASDNGPRSEPTVQQTRVIDFFDSNGNLTGYKRDLYEGGIRDPFIVRWTGHIPAGSVSQVPVYFPDVLPTALDLAAAPPIQTDGISLLPYLLHPNQAANDRFMYWEFYEPVYRQAARLGKWKAVRLKRGGKLELYDLSTDPWESKDVAADHPDVISRIEQGMAREHQSSAEYPDPDKIAHPSLSMVD
ncbi:arylsulfatase A-like enzyme [Edaphobacter aggregans]|uniref:Arylsulfatase A-like enzyme n=1 Tax=Edaphobacter aggregans TaxID=570835 RepID=A0A428MD24_9BACT|nr:arylsulfatase [Edaphobacter aggregans]RSL14775.1 arylsulfatase A-like enzyme [Edaphobacter aggregans]